MSWNWTKLKLALVLILLNLIEPNRVIHCLSMQPMNELISTRPVALETCSYCRSCGTALSSGDNFCSHCGAGCRDLIVPSANLIEIEQQESKAIATVGPSTTLQTLVNSRTFVVSMIAVAGPLGLLALWFSQRFTNRTKILTTTGYVLLAMVLPLVVIWYWLDVALRPIIEALGK